MKNLTWQQQIANAVTDLQVLCRMLELNPITIANAYPAAEQFPLRVPIAFLSRMEKGNPNDPLLLQVLPKDIEMQPSPGYSSDPLNEASASPVYGVLHKYHGRVLLTLTGTCAVHCRYCFRRHYPYSEKVPGVSQWRAALDYIANDASIEEVILSGGDPLIVKDKLLSEFITKLEAIPHLKRLRFHTRLPIVIPDRISNFLVKRLQTSRLKIILVLHTNHANELDDSVASAIKQCKTLSLLNQTVLLKGVNDADSASDLIDLSQRLFEVGVLPYYLHVFDPVAGAAHFDLPDARAKKLHNIMLETLPGYLVPKLVREIPKLGSKQLL